MYIHTLMGTPMTELKNWGLNSFWCSRWNYRKRWRVLKNPVSFSYMYNQSCPISGLDMRFWDTTLCSTRLVVADFSRDLGSGGFSYHATTLHPQFLTSNVTSLNHTRNKQLQPSLTEMADYVRTNNTNLARCIQNRIYSSTVNTWDSWAVWVSRPCQS